MSHSEESQSEQQDDKSSSVSPAQRGSTHLDEKHNANWWQRIDHVLLSTVALTVISLCALFVSIYQTRVLSLQQEVMAEQQHIMLETAKAQLWPNVEVGKNRGYKDGKIDLLEFTIANTGTGPAVIENVTVQYQEQYARSWGELFDLIRLPDSIPRTSDNASINGRVLQSGHFSTFLSMSNYPALMEYMNQVVTKDEGIIITICYRSVFHDYWEIETKYGKSGFGRVTPVDTCIVIENTAFYE